MRRTPLGFVLLAVFSSLWVARPAGCQDHVPGQLTGDMLLRLQGSEAAQSGLLARLEVDLRVDAIERRSGSWPVYTLRLAQGEDVLKLASELERHAAVRWTDPERWLDIVPQGAPLNDPYWDQLWHLENLGQFTGALPGIDVHAVPAWERSTGAGVLVAVLDSGTELDHPDLSTVPGIDVIDEGGDGSPAEGEDGNPHGTAVAGLIAAIGNNGIGVAGVAWEAQVMPVRVIGGGTTSSGHWDAFVEPADSGASVLNNSWGFGSGDEDEPCGPGPDGPSITDPVAYALSEGRRGRGSSVVFSMGNGGCDERVQPILAVDGVVAVGAVNDRGEKWGYSNTGSDLDVVAPSGDAYGNAGQQLCTTDLSGDLGMNGLGDNNEYTASMGGTSGSAPLVSGVLALMYGSNMRITDVQAREVLCLSADRIQIEAGEYDATGWSPLYGCGTVDAAAAVAAVANYGPPDPPTVTSPLSGEYTGPEVVIEWSEAADPDGDPLTYELELFLSDPDEPSGDDDSAASEGDENDDDDSAEVSATGPWLFSDLQERSLDLSGYLSVGEGYGVRIIASDPWGPGLASSPSYFFVRETAAVGPEGGGCTCTADILGGQSGSSGLVALLGLVALGFSRRCPRFEGRDGSPSSSSQRRLGSRRRLRPAVERSEGPGRPAAWDRPPRPR